MEFLILFGLVITAMIGIQFTKEKEIMRVELAQVAQFLAFMAIATFMRIAYYDFALQTGLMKGLPQIPDMIANSRWTLALVFWEDMAFGVPIYFAFKYLKRRWMAIAITIILSALFAAGHSYQGPIGVAITAFLPYFVCYRYGKKFGFGTTMVCHILYDFITFYTVWLLPLLL